jgi:hypothetical protein
MSCGTAYRVSIGRVNGTTNWGGNTWLSADSKAATGFVITNRANNGGTATALAVANGSLEWIAICDNTS